MKELPGSKTFGTSVMKTSECIMMMQAMQTNGLTPLQATLDLEFIDDMLQVLRVKSLMNNFGRRTSTGRLRKDSGFEAVLENRLQQLADDERELTKQLEEAA